MSDIAKIDKNFKIETEINKPDIAFYDTRVAPFKIYGIFYEDGQFRRMPKATAGSVSDGVYALHTNTAGGRVRFKTDSPYVAIKAKMSSVGLMSHFALCGSAGFDLYEGTVHVSSFRPPFDIKDGFEQVIELGASKMRDITINFPLYSNVSELYVGLSESAQICAPSPYANEKPVVYYGSSITQGGCANCAGTSYQDFISRELNLDYINLGFSGNARAEDTMINYIKSLDMSMFVYDYDHNAPNYEHLKNTHEKMFIAIREAQPTLPIIIMSRPKTQLNDTEIKRMELIRATYENAINRGDKNVYFLDGPTLMAISGTDGLVDEAHPTDLGFFSIAKAIVKVIKDNNVAF